MKEISEENQLIPQPPRSNYVSNSDQLILEDEIQRIKLVGSNLDIKKLVTGIVIALLGFENSDGKFEVEDYCFAGVNLNIEKPLSTLSDDWYGKFTFHQKRQFFKLYFYFPAILC